MNAMCGYHIKDYDWNKKEHKKNLQSILLEWEFCIGQKEANGSLENMINIKFILNNYQDLTLEELRLAIDMSMTGVIPVDAQCYGRFSPMYIAKILNAYKKHRDKIIAKVRYKEAQNKLAAILQSNSTPSASELIHERRSLLIEHATKMLIDGETDLSGNLLWNTLARAGVVSDDEISEEAKKYGFMKLQALKNTQYYQTNIKDLTKERVLLKNTNLERRFSRDYMIISFLKDISISDYFSGLADDIIISKD